MTPFATVICGAGIAGIEAALRLRRLAGDRVQITLIDPGESLVYRPLAVREPFALSGARRYPLETVARATGANWIRDAVDGVDTRKRKLQLAGGDSCPTTRCCSHSAAVRHRRTSTRTSSTTATRARRSTASCRTSRTATSRASC